MFRLLVVEDDPPARAACSTFLRRRGFEVIEAKDGLEALDRSSSADLVVLDVMMPGLDGWSVLQDIRSDQPDMPVVMLTALGDLDHRLNGFELGADDYLVKPVDLHELEARIKAVLRRTGLTEEIVRGDLRIVPAQRLAFYKEKPVSLTQLEYALLLALAKSPGRIYTRDELISSVWGADYFGADRTVDVRIARLRKKLGDSANRPHFIETVHDVGYRFRHDYE